MEHLNIEKISHDLTAYILNDEKLSTPVYLGQLKTEQDAETLDLFPIVYIWNENKEAGTFSVSINGKAVGHILEGAMPRKSPFFDTVRDTVMKNLSQVSQATIIETCQEIGAVPSDIFPSM